jgi:hypothetical protein
VSKRKDILDGRIRSNWMRSYGLLYTCNAGWLDLGHLNPNNLRQEIGATNLWNTIKNEGNNSSRCFIKTRRGIRYRDNGECNDKFPDGSEAFQVYYRQDHGGIPGKPGREGRYLVKKGLTIEQKKMVALSILMEVTIKFENLQEVAGWFGVTDSGYSQEDLVSNLIGFYIATGEVNRMTAIEACHPISDRAARKIWDTEGPVGDSKNKKWSPSLAVNTNIKDGDKSIDECAHSKKKFPKIFQKIKPVRKGIWHKDFF